MIRKFLNWLFKPKQELLLCDRCGLDKHDPKTCDEYLNELFPGKPQPAAELVKDTTVLQVDLERIETGAPTPAILEQFYKSEVPPPELKVKKEKRVKDYSASPEKKTTKKAPAKKTINVPVISEQPKKKATPQKKKK